MQGVKVSGMCHSFDIRVAIEHGLEEAIFISNFYRFFSVNKKLKQNFHEESYWTPDILDEVAVTFPYWSRDKIFEMIKRIFKVKLINNK